jgi:hypothetical protein
VIDDHRCGLADNEDSSRNILRARRFHHGLANRCKPACNLGANKSSAACEYEMNPSYERFSPDAMLPLRLVGISKANLPNRLLTDANSFPHHRRTGHIVKADINEASEDRQRHLIVCIQTFGSTQAISCVD